MTRLLILAGFVPLPAWLILATIAGLITPGYSPIESHVSVMSLEQGPTLWLTNSAALISGTALIAFGLGVWAASGRVFSGGGLCWSVFGVAMLGNGMWPMGDPMHGIYAIGIINILGPALTLLESREDAVRQRLIGFTVFCSLAGVFYLWMLVMGFDPDGYSGLTQRIFGSINYLWPLVFAYTVRKQAEGLTHV